MAKLNGEVQSEEVGVRLKQYLGACDAIVLTSEGYEPLTIPSAKGPERPPVPYAFPTLLSNDGRMWANALDLAAVEHVRATGCGKVYRINLLVGRGPITKDAVVVRMLAPGSTLVPPLDQDDVDGAAVNLVQNSRRGGNDDCRQVSLIDNTTVKRPPASSQAGWVETWDVAYCDFHKSVEVTFTPSSDGSIIADGKIMQ